MTKADNKAIAVALYHTLRNGINGDYRMWAGTEDLATMEQLFMGRYKNLLPTNWEISWVPKGYAQKIVSHTNGTTDRYLFPLDDRPLEERMSEGYLYR